MTTETNFLREEKMRKILVSVFAMALVMMAAGCGDTETVVEGTAKTEVVGAVTSIDIDNCTSNAQCEIDEVCEEVDEFVSSQDKVVPVSMCVFGCDATLDKQTVVNPDGTSVTVIFKVEGTDTCQRDGTTTLTCDMKTDSATFRQCIENRGEPVVDPVEPTPEVTGVRFVEYCYSGGAFDGLWGQISWSESTVLDPDAWKPGRDLDITNGCFGTNVIWADVLTEAGFKTFYADLTEGKHTGNKEVDAALVWLGANWYPDTCAVDGVPGVLGEFVQGKGHPCIVAE